MKKSIALLILACTVMVSACSTYSTCPTYSKAPHSKGVKVSKI